MTENGLIIPSQIPWEDIKDTSLEELMYWLLDTMGAKDLEWRIGGTGGGAADQGRDLECSFYMTSPEGDLTQQRWWVDAKGRNKTVDPTDVKETILNVTGKKHVDVLLIATNACFSNPTRDWVKEHQKNHPRPVIKLWEKTELEKLCSKNPLAVIRLFSKALSPQGKLEVMRSRLWNYATLTDEPTLKALWGERDNLDITAETLLALVISESANGDLTRRAWGMFVNDETLLNALATFLGNFFVLVFRADEQGIKQEPYIQATAYLVLCCIDRFGAKAISELLQDWSQFDDREWPDKIKNYILSPVLDTLVLDLRDVCTSDCSRVSTSLAYLSETDVEKYWSRLVITDDPDKSDEPQRVLSIERNDTPCKVGFCVNKDIGCPINSNDNPEKRIFETLTEIERIVKYRKSENT